MEVRFTKVGLDKCVELLNWLTNFFEKVPTHSGIVQRDVINMACDGAAYCLVQIVGNMKPGVMDDQERRTQFYEALHKRVLRMKDHCTKVDHYEEVQ